MIACRVVVHTGNWGTGAFGGNKVLMACLQMYAARVVGLDELVFHTFEPSATAANPFRLLLWLTVIDELRYKAGRELYESLLDKPVDEALDTLYNKKFHWGQSDGN